ncbi:amino acid ABC transporter ATP-binding protein [Oenococcus alcoholitolerans]|uniref:amino acid ABC transporter ATP-binding protein n=1 Tax=Oenococcus alcoholitolerans TaxID=931074 RepID=UPI003F72F7F1
MIKLSHINKRYNDKKVLVDVSTDFLPQQTSVLVGPSGAGKSTLIRSLNLLEIPDSGRYSINDIEVDFSKAISNRILLRIRRQTGMVFQDYNLFPHFSVLENLMEGPVQVLKKDKQQVKEESLKLLDKVGLKDKAQAYPNSLSGGQQQRVAIARALAMHPSYLLLDEPTSALDPESELDVLKVLQELSKEGQSMVVITHNMEFARAVSDKIVFVEHGQILYDGQPDKFFNSDNKRISDFLSAMSFKSLNEEE